MTTEEIIKQFFEGKCNSRDVAMVQAWLEENPGKLKEFIGVEEWDDFQPAHVLSPELSRKLWSSINKQTSTPAVQYPWFKWMVVAASVLLVIGLSWQFMSKEQKTGFVAAATMVKPIDLSNTTPQKMTVALSDGSTVELLPRSTISYPKTTVSDPEKRDVLLSGEATFDIAKDVARPFSVYGHSIVITVLGTRFTVRPYGSDNAAKVILQEGRVMVKISDSSSRDYKKEYYLTPGDIFIFSGSARVMHLEKDKDGRYVFDNYPLDVVFDQLQLIYSKKITYNKAELGNRSFIGKIDKKDSLSHILQSISLLNKFDLHQKDDSFIIGN